MMDVPGDLSANSTSFPGSAFSEYNATTGAVQQFYGYGDYPLDTAALSTYNLSSQQTTPTNLNPLVSETLTGSTPWVGYPGLVGGASAAGAGLPGITLSGSTHTHSPPKRKRKTTPTQRLAANNRERRRMCNLNTAFDRLRKKVPTFPHEKRLSRIQTLRLAMTYIAFMTEVLTGQDIDVLIKQQQQQQQHQQQQQPAISAVPADPLKPSVWQPAFDHVLDHNAFLQTPQ